MSSRPLTWPITTAVLGVILLVIALPNNWKAWAPDFLQPTLHLGLDLQGGTQLDFRISESEMEKQIADLRKEIESLENDPATSPEEIADRKAQIGNIQALQRNIVESIRTVIERRINALGVSEAVITPSYYGQEKHLLVECPGVVEIQECIDTVGKTILLEFKEQHDGEDDAHARKMRELALQAYVRATGSGETLDTIGQDLGPTLGVFYTEKVPFYEDELPEGAGELWGRSAEDPPLLLEVTLDPVETGTGTVDHRGLFLAKVVSEKSEAERTILSPGEAMEHLAGSSTGFTLTVHEEESFDDLDEGYYDILENLIPGTLAKAERSDEAHSILFVTDRVNTREIIEASHILIAYHGASRAGDEVSRSRDEARFFADDLRERLDAGERFETIARTYSDGPSGKDGGSLGSFGRGTMTPAFEEAVFALAKGEISDVVETEFGFHLIRLDSEPTIERGTLTYIELVFSDDENVEQKREEVLADIRNQSVARIEEQITLQSLLFSFLPTGWKDTALDGKHFRRATVTTDPLTGIPVVQIAFDQEGGDLFYDLTKRNIGKPVAIFVGGELISAPTVQSEIPGGIAIITGSRTFDEANQLAQDLNTGAIPAPIHLVGQVTVEATLGAEALKQSLRAALLGFVLVAIYMIWFYRVLGFIAAISLSIYAIIFFAILKLPLFLFTSQHIVLTLAGISGIILSIGMAVDANVLIFERMKEELKKGKLLQTAADTGFRRAWTSIRDSNISTLLTAAILFIIGTSIVRGFAITLSLGILLSMFTAVVVTRFLIRLLYKSPIAENMEAFGIKPPSPSPNE